MISEQNSFRISIIYPFCHIYNKFHSNKHKDYSHTFLQNEMGISPERQRKLANLSISYGESHKFFHITLLRNI